MRKIKLYILLVLFLPFFDSCEKDENILENKNEPYNKTITAIVTQDDNVWVATRANGLYKSDGESWITYNYSDGLVSDTITALAFSNNGSLWVGTNMGVSKFENKNWINYTELDGLYNNDIRSLVCDQQNNIWIGTRNNRLVKYDGSSFTDYHINPTASGPKEMGHIHAIACDLDGNVWVGSCISGLSKFDGTTWTDCINGLNVFVGSSFCTANGDVWIGHYTGAYKFSSDVWTQYTETDGLVNNAITSFTFDQQNNMWIGTGSGLSKYDGTLWTNYTTDNGLLSNNITALACDQNGDIWVGSALGLTKLYP